MALSFRFAENQTTIDRLRAIGAALHVNGSGLQGCEVEEVAIHGKLLSADDISSLAGLYFVKRLDLSLTNVDDKMLSEPHKLQTLKEMTLRHTKVTSDGIERFKQAVPECQVVT